MPLWILLLLIVGLTVAMYFMLRPVQVLSPKQWLASHLVIWIGLWLIMGHILLMNVDNPQQVSELLGGIWTLGGGVCLAVVYMVRQFKKNSSPNRMS